MVYFYFNATYIVIFIGYASILTVYYPLFPFVYTPF